jgi:bifunctional UDP-N-acetylglucosamine pyrophosphorylase/glucosamine-1-phosphate N-acetyltransferase
MRAGVTMVDPASTYLDGSVELDEDVVLQPATHLVGTTRIGRGAVIGPSTRLVDTVVGPRSRVEFAAAVQASVGADAHVGPFANLEPGSVVPDGFKSGPFFKGVASRDAESQAT